MRRWLHDGSKLRLDDTVQEYAKLLQRCTQTKSLKDGRFVHQRLINCRLDGSTFLANLLVNMYGKCGSATEARQVFEGIRKRNIFSWSSMLAAYAQNGHCKEALQLYHLMDLDGSSRPDAFIFSSVLNVCSTLGDPSKGKEVHDRISQCGLTMDKVAQNSLLNMYTKCGRLSDAQALFEEMPEKNVVSWNIMMIAYAQNGHVEESLEMYQSMTEVEPDCVSHVSAISACTSLLDLDLGRSIHARVAASGWDSSEVLKNALINLYGKCGSLDEAKHVFDSMGYSRTAISWNAVIAAFAQSGNQREVIELYHGMDLEGVVPSRVTFLAVVAACWKLTSIEEVRDRIVQCGFGGDISVATALVDSYSKCGSLKAAKTVFYSSLKNTVSWNAMIGAYISHGKSVEALQLFHEMSLEGFALDEVTFTLVLGACSELRDLKLGTTMHQRLGRKCTGNVHHALINMYAKCGSLENAMEVFEATTERSLGSWNTIIAACVLNSQDTKALELYKAMRAENDAQPDTFTFASVLNACTTLCDLVQGKAVHRDMETCGAEVDDVVHAALINMYGKCEDLQNARRVFNSKEAPPPVSWNTLIAACVQCNYSREALQLFQRMDLEGIRHLSVTCVSTFAACTNIGVVSKGEQIYMRLLASGLETEEIETAVMNMYHKCGRLADARAVFDKMKTRNPICWTAMFAAYSHHVCALETLELLCLMSLEGIHPNQINFTSILNACSHGGLRDDGLKSFYSMQFDYGVSSSPEHCICVSDMLARAGLLIEAEDWLKQLPFQLDSVAWKSLLNASNMHGNIEVGARVAKKVANMEPDLSAPYIVLSNSVMQAN